MPEEVRADLLLGRDTLSPGLVKAGRAASDAASNVSELTRDLYELNKQRATPVVDLQDDKANAKLADVTAKLKDLGAKVANPNVDLKDKGAVAAITAMQVKLDALGRKVASPRITLEGLGRAEAGIAALDLQMDRLGKRSAAGGGGLAALLGGGGLAALLGGAGGGTGIAAAIAASVPLIPALLPALLGGGVGFGAGGLALALGSKGAPLLKADQQALARARAAVAASPGTAPTAAQLLTLRLAQQKLAHDQAIYGEFAPLNRTFSGLGQTALGTFASALESHGQGFSGHPGGPSFLQGLTGILKQLGGFIKSIGPELGALFRASLPYLQSFVGFLEKAAKVLLPAFVQMLNEMAPFLPVLTQGLLNIVKGFAGFLNAIGPSGMKASARIFVVLTEGMAGALVALGHTINWLTENIPTWIRKIHNEWDILRHDTAVIFDNIRHGIAADWDLIFSNSIGRIIRGGHDIEREWNTWTHNTGVIFDAFRHSVATVWDLIWNNTIGKVKAGISAVIGYFKGLPGRALGALYGLGHSLYAFAHAALTDFLNGLKAVGGAILSWLGSLWHNIIGLAKKVLGVFSPSRVFYDIGKNLMVGLFHGIRDHAHQAVNAAEAAAGAAGGRVSGSVNSWIIAAIKGAGKPLSWLPALERLVSLESGGNPRAVNPIAVLGQHASGLWQMLPSTFYSYGGRGSLFNPVTEGIAALRYIAANYGSPFNIPGLFTGGYRGYASGGMITEPVLGLGLRSGRGYGFGENGPEMVVPGGSGAGGQTVVVNVQVGHGTSPVAAAREIADILNTGARSGVRLRRSILSPNG